MNTKEKTHGFYDISDLANTQRIQNKSRSDIIKKITVEEGGVLTDADKCPFCGIERKSRHNPVTCKDRQIANLQERLEAWREYYRAKDMKASIKAEILQKLKDIGEI